MKAVVQRVKRAQVTVEEDVRAIGKGIIVYCAFKASDTDEKIKWAAGRIAKLRIFYDENQKFNKSVLDEKGEALVISNFTLYGNCLHGTRPDFSKAAPADIALPMYELFVKTLEENLPVKTGFFGKWMQVAVEADGPATVVVEN